MSADFGDFRRFDHPLFVVRIEVLRDGCWIGVVFKDEEECCFGQSEGREGSEGGGCDIYAGCSSAEGFGAGGEVELYGGGG